jgi:exosome complex component CSL4
MKKGRPEKALPGDKLGVIEEFSGVQGTYELDGEVRSLFAGSVEYDLVGRRLAVKSESLRSPLPSIDAVVMGTVEAMQTNGAIVRIYAINDVEVDSNLEGMLLTRSRSSTPCKPGDIVRAKVTSLTNGVVFLGFRGDDYGVIKAWCSICGEPMEGISGSKAKCVVCGNLEYRKMAGFAEERGFRERRRFSGRRAGPRGRRRSYGERPRRSYGRSRRRY